MGTRSRTVTTLACIAVGAACVLGLGAASTASQQQQTSVFGQNTFGVSFAGGSVNEFVDALRDASGDVPVNVIVSGHTHGLSLPSIVLERVSVASAVRSLEHLNVEPYRIDVASTDGASEGVLAIAVYRRDTPDTARANFRPGPSQTNAALEVISLTELLEGHGEDGARADTATLLTAIDTALNMAGDTQSADLKFHPDSHLLIIKGSERQTDLVRRLINEVHEDVVRRRNFTSQLRSQLRDAEIDVQKADVEIQSAESGLEIAAAEMETLRQLHNGGMVGDTELLEAERSIQQMRSHLEISHLEREQRMHRMSALIDQLRASEQRFQAPTTAEAIEAEIARLRARIHELQDRLNELKAEGRRAR